MILRADFALPDLTKIFQNRHLRYASFASTNLTKIRPNRKIHEHSLGETKFRQIRHFRACISGQKRASALLLILSFLFLPFFSLNILFSFLSFFPQGQSTVQYEFLKGVFENK